jgi:hydroxypyruvate isomerase
MPRFAANLSMLFTEAPLLERFERAARAGFQAVEVQFPYEVPAQEVAARLKASGLPMVLHNLPGGNWAAGERGIACHPDRVEEFRAGVQRALEYAQALDVPTLNCLAGIAPAGVDDALLRRTFVDNVRHAAAALKAAGRRLVIEPINRHDVPGFWLHRTDQALSLLDEVGSDNAFVQYDLYHAQRTEGELCGTLSRHLARIGHVQIADNPGRHEPGTGEIHWPRVFAHLDRVGYAGWVGCEYKPAGVTEEGLGWMRRLS